MIPVWLVRHGEAAATWGQHPDPGLSELGQRQAESVAEELLPVLPSDVRLISSPKQRAQETALPLAQQLGRPVAIHSAFKEIDAPVPLEERQTWLKAFMTQRWDEQPENLWQWRRDIIEALEILTEPTVIFTHFMVINTVFAHLSGNPATVQSWPDNASAHELARVGDGLQLRSVGRQLTTLVN